MVEGGPYREEVVKEAEMEIHGQRMQGRDLQPRPNRVPREIRLDPGDAGRGGSVHQPGLGFLEAVDIHTVEVKHLPEELQEASILARRLTS